MSTNCVVAFTTEAGIVGRRVHADGYPDHMIPTLTDLIAREGAEAVMQTILSADQGGWSYIIPRLSEPHQNHLGKDRARVVPGYGLAYTDIPHEPPIRWEDARGNFSYGYVVDTKTGAVAAYRYCRDLTEEWES